MPKATLDMTTTANMDSISPQKVLSGIADLYREPEWLSANRRKALDVYRSTPRPDRVTHLWRYTDPTQFENNNGRSTPAPPVPGLRRNFPAVIDDALATESLAAAVYVRDGLVWKTAIDDKIAARGVLVMDLHEAALSRADLVEPYLGSLIGPEFGKFEAYVNAAWTGGLLIYIPRGVEVDRPIHIVTAQPQSGSYRSGRLLVIVESQASLTLIDEYGEGMTGSEDNSHTTNLVELFVADAGRLHYSAIQNWNRGTTAYLTQRARLSADANLDTVFTSVGAGTAKVDAGAVLAGKGAESNMYGLAIGDQKQHFDHHTVHLHESGHTRSDLHFKVALRDEADSVYTGLIRIEEEADFCEAYQENRNLVLAPGARAESIPELEIMNNEVRCTHGATVGKIDPQEVFYLMSRGIEEQDAIHLIVAGFVGPILDHLPKVAHDRIEKVVVSRLEGDVTVG
jgi:Fe-S cluster assembly protein SufD